MIVIEINLIREDNGLSIHKRIYELLMVLFSFFRVTQTQDIGVL